MRRDTKVFMLIAISSGLIFSAGSATANTAVESSLRPTANHHITAPGAKFNPRLSDAERRDAAIAKQQQIINARSLHAPGAEFSTSANAKERRAQATVQRQQRKDANSFYAPGAEFRAASNRDTQRTAALARQQQHINAQSFYGPGAEFKQTQSKAEQKAEALSRRQQAIIARSDASEDEFWRAHAERGNDPSPQPREPAPAPKPTLAQQLDIESRSVHTNTQKETNYTKSFGTAGGGTYGLGFGTSTHYKSAASERDTAADERKDRDRVFGLAYFGF